MFTDEKSRCFGEIKIGFDRVFGATSSSVIDDCWPRRTETEGVAIQNTSRALPTAGRAIEQVRFKETISEKFYDFIKYDFGMQTCAIRRKSDSVRFCSARLGSARLRRK